MKTRAALALSLAGILVTGSAALAVNTHVLNTTPAGTGNANRILLPSNTGNSPAPAAAISATAVPNVTPNVGGGSTPPPPAKTVGKPESENHKGGRKAGSVTKKSDAGPAKSQPAGTTAFQPDAGPAGSQPDGTAASQTNASPAVVSVQPGDDKGGLGPASEPGTDKGKQRNASEPGGDSGGHGSDD
ncbi:hypothetical protein [Arthrobacter sp. NPDC057013]|uniref:hypothetical protein n=1 Tax=Arthrobacter sp. NPDC057013 TaxID=3345999 RepID=UPI00363F52B6